MKDDTLPIQAATDNRRRFRKRLGKSILVLEGAKEIQRNSTVNFSFRQESNFLYLTAYNEADAKLILTEDEEYLFIPEITEHHLVWIGEAETKESAKKKYRLLKVLYVDQFDDTLKRLAKRKRDCYCSKSLKRDLSKAYPKLQIQKDEDCKTLLAESRVIKSPLEIKIMEQIARLSSKAHIELMKKVSRGMYEDQAQAILEGYLRDNRIQEFAYPSIVAAGKNAAVLHYTKNNAQLKNQDFLLVDAGGEYRGYASDITRTFPVNGNFSAEQREIYQVVLDAQKQCIEMIKPGIHINDIHDRSVEAITYGLLRLGFLKGEMKDLIEEKAYFVFYPHGVSHMLGVDVHDATPYFKSKKKGARRDCKIEAGNVLTVEPGLYFIEALLNNKDLKKSLGSMVNWSKAKKYIKLGGVRIEDDVLVTRKGNRLLSRVPKEIDEIEKLMAEARA